MKRLLFFLMTMTILYTTAAFADSNINANADSKQQALENPPSIMASTDEDVPFSVDGNLTVDDYASSDDNKLFYTVHDKEGNEYYIVVDGARDHSNVYFLNAVDTNDLLSIASDNNDIYSNNNDMYSRETKESTSETTTENTTENTTKEVVTVSEKTSGTATLPIIMIAVIAFVIIYFVRKKKRENADEDNEDDVDNEQSTENDDDNKEAKTDNSEETFTSKSNSDYEPVAVNNEK